MLSAFAVFSDSYMFLIDFRFAEFFLLMSMCVLSSVLKFLLRFRTSISFTFFGGTTRKHIAGKICLGGQIAID